MKKRILTALLAVCLVAALGTVGAWADGTVLPDPVNGVITLTNRQFGIANTWGSSPYAASSRLTDSSTR